MKRFMHFLLLVSILFIGILLNCSCQPQNPSTYPIFVYPPLTDTPFPTLTSTPTVNATATFNCVAFVATFAAPCP